MWFKTKFADAMFFPPVNKVLAQNRIISEVFKVRSVLARRVLKKNI